MKFISTIVLLCLTLISKATTWNVEVGGTSSSTPYYSPAHITIQVGDIVKWTFVSGLHNVTSTSGPAPFASGDKVGNPDGSSTYSKTFDLPGVYTYNCTFKGHSQFQNGSITVEGTVGMNKEIHEPIIEFLVYPNPTKDVVTIERSFASEVDIRIMDITGKTVLIDNNVTDIRKQISISSLTKGIYFIELKHDNRISRKRLLVS